MNSNPYMFSPFFGQATSALDAEAEGAVQVRTVA